jgi:signal transduction histidine kinase
VRLVLEAASDPAGGRRAIEFQMHDTGPGLSDDLQARLFEAPVHPKGRRPGEGAGLGLYLSHRLAQLIGARLRFESRPGKGSVFALALPEPGA